MTITRPLLMALCCVLCACVDPARLDVPRQDSGMPPIPPEDVIAACDQAVDGTPCGAATEDKHCVFGACSDNVCGDGVPAFGEQCDDGNDIDSDSCNTRCVVTVASERCGNGHTDDGEECDDGNRNSDDGCSNACEARICRNERVDFGEECDDGNRIHTDECSNACTWNVCGNARRDPGEECDDGNRVDDDSCALACTANVCGNLRVDPGEVCDGDVVDGLACNNQCSGRSVDQCVVCMSEHCGATYDYDVFTSCRVAVIAEQVPSPTSNFVQKCTALDECVRRNDCYDASLGTIECFCGVGVDTAQCQAGLDVRGPCIEEGYAATVCMPNDPACVVSLWQDLTLPSGFASYLAACRDAECAEACAR